MINEEKTICPSCNGEGEWRHYGGKDYDCDFCNKTGIVTNEQYKEWFRKTSNPVMQARFDIMMGGSVFSV